MDVLVAGNSEEVFGRYVARLPALVQFSASPSRAPEGRD